jgi:hypothetical protein
MVAQPRDVAELAMLAKRNWIVVHASNLVRPARNAMAGSGRLYPVRSLE